MSSLYKERPLPVVSVVSRWQNNITPPTVKDFNPIVIIYRRPMFLSDTMLWVAGAGEFTHCELYLPMKGATFAIFAGGELQCSISLRAFYEANPDKFAWHLYILKDAEYERLMRWNVAQVEHKCPYNFKDLAWQLAPSLIQRACVCDLNDQLSHDPHRTFCSQAVILALREAFNCANTKSHLKAFALSMNSRITTPTQLARSAVKYFHSDAKTTGVPMTWWDARDEYLRDVPYGFRSDEFPGLNDSPSVKTR
jgi:hypothetical protein